MQAPQSTELIWHGTTILTVRKAGKVVIGGDGQVSIGQTVIKSNAKKVRKLGKGDVIGGFAGATADAFTLFERLESKLEQYPGQLTRAAVELAKDWRTDRYLRRLEAMMIVADKQVSLVLTGTGDVLEPEAGVGGIGSGGNYPPAAARPPPPRRLAKLASAPFLKVEATKFTEVGYVGRDVEQIVRDLVEIAITLTREKKRKDVQARAQQAAENRVLDALVGANASAATKEAFRRK